MVEWFTINGTAHLHQAFSIWMIWGNDCYFLIWIEHFHIYWKRIKKVTIVNEGDSIKVTPTGWIDKHIWREINDILKLHGFSWLSNEKDSCWLKMNIWLIHTVLKLYYILFTTWIICNCLLFFVLRGLVLNIKLQHGQCFPSQYMKTSQTEHIFCPWM